MKTAKQPQCHETEPSWYQVFFNSTELFLTQGKLTEILENELEDYGINTSHPITEKNTQNACIVLIHWILFMYYECINKWYDKDYFDLFEECHDISKHNCKLSPCPCYAKEVKAMTKEKEKAAIDYITQFMYNANIKKIIESNYHTSLAPIIEDIIDEHSLLETYKGLTKCANNFSNLLYNCIYFPDENFLIALGKEANSSIDFPSNDGFSKILDCKPHWKEMIASMRNDDYHQNKLGTLVWMRRSAHQHDYIEEIALHYWIQVCIVEDMHQIDDDFGYVEEKNEKEKIIIPQYYEKKFIQATPIWEEFVKKGYLEREGKVYRWLGNKRQFGYFIYYAHKYLHKNGTHEDKIEWPYCCTLFSMPLSSKSDYTNGCSKIRVYEKNKQNKSKKCDKLPKEAIEISKIFKYMKK